VRQFTHTAGSVSIQFKIKFNITYKVMKTHPRSIDIDRTGPLCANNLTRGPFDEEQLGLQS
jgi:hypothetical protein